MDSNTTNLHPTLLRQVLKYFGSLDAVPTEWKGFLQAVSDTYRHADEDRAQIERSLELSSRELGEYISQLKATLDSTNDGILVVDSEGKIVRFNQQFVSMWRIPDEVIASRDDKRAIAFVLEQLKDPDAFVAKVKELYGQPDATSLDILEFKDGRVFERHSLPQKVGDRTVARVWSFHDITDDRKAQAQLQDKVSELERLNKLTMGREVMMADLKVKMRALEEKLKQAGIPFE